MKFAGAWKMSDKEANNFIPLSAYKFLYFKKPRKQKGLYISLYKSKYGNI